MAFRWIGKSTDGNSVTLRHLKQLQFPLAAYATPAWLEQNADILRKGVVLDVETSGLNQAEESIIEIALKQFTFNKNTGEIVALNQSYSSFQDPGKALSAEITSLTGITDEMVAGQQINWQEVDQIFLDSQIVIAHNARFDRPFVDRKSRVSPERIWACTFKQIDWHQHGFSSSKLELLNIYHGFFTDSHRAMNDVEALLYLLALATPETPKPYLAELLTNARRQMAQVIANGAPFDSKDHLKGRGYSWDNLNRFWSKVIFKDDLKSELQWLEEIVYCGPFAGITREIALQDNFKA